jgi:hypothetical protein
MMSYSPRKKDFIELTENGFKIVEPISERTIVIEWAWIDTIIYVDYIDSNSQYILYLNHKPEMVLHPNPWWLNRIFNYLFPIKAKKQRIDSGFNKDFGKLNPLFKKYLLAKQIKDVDPLRGKLLHSETIKKKDKTIIKEKWKPVKNYEPWQMVYDRYGRTVDDIYKRDGSI